MDREARARASAAAGDVAGAEPGQLSRLLAEMASSPEVDPRTWADGLVPGERVGGRYELLRELGRGGFGVVFEARDTSLPRHVAFKAMPPRRPSSSPEREALLRREADALAPLHHQNIVTLHDAALSREGPYRGPFLVLELLRGETLGERLQRGPLPVAEAVRIATEIAHALDHAHGCGVLHRDLKPANVFLSRDSGVKVLDFGLAHVWGAGGPAGSGTPGYMAPEQRRGGAEDARTDLHGLGVILHEMLTGARPVPGDGGDAPLRPRGRRIPSSLADLVERLTDPEPRRRPASAAGVASQLGGIERRRRRRLALALAASSAATAAVLATIAYDGFVALPPEYYVWLDRARACAARPVLGQDCSDLFRRAIAIADRGPEAHLGLAVWARWYGGSLEQQRSEIERAERYAWRASRLDRHLIHAWSEHLHGREDESLAALDDVGRRWPGDRRAFYDAADLLLHRDELEAAIPRLERVAALDPDYGWAAGHLADSLGALGRTAALETWARTWEEAGTPAALHGLSLARGWLGDVRGAAEAAQRAIDLGAQFTAQQDLLGAAVMAGRYADAERMVRPLTVRPNPVRRIGFYAVAALEAYQGRRRAGLAALDELRREIPEVAGDVLYHGVRADYLLGDGDARGVWEEAEALRRLDARAAAELAPSLAWLGDAEHAAQLARDLRRGSMLDETYQALAAWNRGDRDAALARLRAAADRMPVTRWRLAPVWLYGELAARAGSDAEAVRALERFERLYVPRMMWRSWAHPAALVLLSRSYERLGDAARARAWADRLASEWAGADPAGSTPCPVRADTARPTPPR